MFMNFNSVKLYINYYHRLLHALQDRNDRKIWNLYPDGNFTVKNCSSLIDIIEFNGVCSFQTRVRISTAPLKIQTFTWLAVQGRICTRT
jgi:hypothetical protein